MKMLLTTLVAATALTASVQAHDSGPGPGGMMGPGNDSMNGMMGPGMMMGGYSDDQRERFNQSYREMERLMERIHQTDDPDERDRLMHEHMHRLQEGMMMMGRGWTPGNRSGDAPREDTESWMRNMEQRMFMMQMMMNQLIERDARLYRNEE